MRIAVCGCGPAGMAAAALLARDGHDVTMFERFEVARPVGSGLMIQPTGLAVLAAMGLAEAVVTAGARIERLFGRAMPSGRTVLDVRYAALGGEGRFGVGIHRAALFGVLHGAVLAAGVPVQTGHAVVGVEQGWLVFEGGQRAGPFELVVDALGTSTPLVPPCGTGLAYGALWASLDQVPGFDGAALEQRYVRASRMVGVLPVGGAQAGGPQSGGSPGRVAFFWSLRVDGLAAWRAAGLEPWKREVRALWPETGPLLEQIGSAEALTFARYTHRTVARPVRDGVIAIGDAWHSASPQLGQGANMALLDAYALAVALRQGRGAAGMVRLRRRHVRLYQAMSAMFTPAYQGDGRVLPIVRDRIVGPLNGVWPVSWVTAAMVAGIVGAPLRGLGLPVRESSGLRAGPQPGPVTRAGEAELGERPA